MKAPETIWCVVDSFGHVNAHADFEIAQAQAKLWDLQYPSLAPHVVLHYSIETPKETANVNADPAVAAEAP